MPLDFPNDPAVGDIFAGAGARWLWDGAKWTSLMTSGGPFLPLTGGALSGLLTCQDGLAVDGPVSLDRTAALAISVALQSVYTGTITIAPPYTNQIFQRDTRTGGLFGKGVGNILLTVNPSQPVTVLEHRLRNALMPSAVIQDWTTSVPPLAPGSQIIALTAPAGLYQYLVDLRANHDFVSVVSTTHAVMVGELIAFAGQSLAEDMVSTAASGDTTTIATVGLTASVWGFIFAAYASNGGSYPAVADGADVNYPPTSWEIPRDSGGVAFKSTFAVEFLNRLITLAGVPCAMIGYAVGGTGIDSWLPGYVGANPGHWTKLVNVLTLAGGKFGTFIWDQGHYETKNGNTSSNYYSQLQQLESNVDVAFPAANYASIIATIPGIGSYGSGPGAIEMVRNTAKQYAATVALTSYVDGYDATLFTDLVHPSQVGNVPYAQHFYRAVAAQWGLHTYGDKGPVITGGTRAYADQHIVLNVTQTNGGAAWVAVGAVQSQFQVFPSGTTMTPIALDSTSPIDLSNPNRIVLLLAAPATEGVALDVWYRRPPDTPAIIGVGLYDNVTDPDGLPYGRQMWDTAAPITIAAPTISLTLNAVADTTPSASIAASGTYSPAPPSSLDYSFDGGVTWLPAGATIGGGTFAFSVNAPAAPGLYKLRVRDHIVVGSIGTSNAFLTTLASPPVLPTLANQIFAFDAYAARGALFTDTGATIQAAIGDTVQCLIDTTGNNNSFNQPTLALAPRLIGNVKNTLPGLRFTGSLSQFLHQFNGTISSVLQNSTGYVILAVFTPATVTAAPSAECVAFGGLAGGAFIKARVHQISTGIVRASRNADGNNNNVAAPTAIGANAIAKVVTRWDGTLIKIALNAQAEASAAITGTFLRPWTPDSMIGASADNPTDSFLDGWVHEIRVWNVLAADTDRTNLLTYATSKWGSV